MTAAISKLSGRQGIIRNRVEEKNIKLETLFDSITSIINIREFTSKKVQIPVSIKDNIVQLTNTGFVKISNRAIPPSIVMNLSFPNFLSTKLIKRKTVNEVNIKLKIIRRISGFSDTRYPAEQIKTQRRELNPSTLTPPG
jgi:hypothetical protein